MATYKVLINTDNFTHFPCSKKNWEPGTINDFMMAINGWKSTERGLQEVRWRIELFSNTHIIIVEISIGKSGLTGKRTKLSIGIVSADLIE